MRADPLGEFRVRIDAGPHGRAAQGQLGQFVGRPPDAVDRPLRLACVTEKLLAEADRRRILKVGPSGLDHGHEFFRLALECFLEEAERRHQLLVDGDQGRQLHR